MSETLKQEIFDSVEMIGTLKFWIQLNIQKIVGDEGQSATFQVYAN